MTDKELLWGALAKLECELRDRTPCNTCLYDALRRLNEVADRREEAKKTEGKEVIYV
jgi:hypothetical protein